jgi:hypothetical protein
VKKEKRQWVPGDREVWVKKKKEPKSRLYTEKQVLKGYWGGWGELDDYLPVWHEVDPTEAEAPAGPMFCDWCGRERHDDDCEVGN